MSQQKAITDYFSGHRQRTASPQTTQSGSPQTTQSGSQSTLRLPHHTRALWRIAYSRLFQISTGQLRSWEDVLEILCDLAVETRQVDRRAEVHLECLLEVSRRDSDCRYLDLICRSAQWAIDAPRLFPDGFTFPILKQRVKDIVTLSREQIRCLLALMFWCALPKQEREHNLPRDYTFYRVLGPAKGRKEQQVAKIVCLLTYFEDVKELQGERCVTFRRCYLTDSIVWPNSTKRLTNVFIDDSKELIETKDQMIKIDFANNYFGGGVLGHGSVQEECMLYAYVEPIVGVLFLEQLTDKEAIQIQGGRVINRYSGYQSDFQWESRVTTDESLDALGRHDDTIVVIDAVNFEGRELEQYYGHWIERELNKALLGFRVDDVDMMRPVATGNWGCGAFRGDPQLKMLIQWAAASEVGRSLYFVTWLLPELQRLPDVFVTIREKKVGDLVRLLLKYRTYREQLSVFEYILRESNF